MVGRALLITAALSSAFRQAGWWIIVGCADLSGWAGIVWPTGWWVGAVAILTDEAIGATVAVGAASWRWLAKTLCAVATGWTVRTAGAGTIWLAGTRDTATAVFTACLVGAIRIY